MVDLPEPGPPDLQRVPTVAGLCTAGLLFLTIPQSPGAIVLLRAPGRWRGGPVIGRSPGPGAPIEPGRA
jgi:hypothetical protein